MSIDFLWIQVKKHNDSTIHLMRPQLINSILKDLHLQDSSNNEDLLALSTRILHKNSEGGDTKQEFHYQVSSASFIFQKNSTRPDITYAVHQCTRFSTAP